MLTISSEMFGWLAANSCLSLPTPGMGLPVTGSMPSSSGLPISSTVTAPDAAPAAAAVGCSAAGAAVAAGAAGAPPQAASRRTAIRTNGRSIRDRDCMSLFPLVGMNSSHRHNRTDPMNAQPKTPLTNVERIACLFRQMSCYNDSAGTSMPDDWSWAGQAVLLIRQASGTLDRGALPRFDRDRWAPLVVPPRKATI